MGQMAYGWLGTLQAAANVSEAPPIWAAASALELQTYVTKHIGTILQRFCSLTN